jgi:hypothetical protein
VVSHHEYGQCGDAGGGDFGQVAVVTEEVRDPVNLEALQAEDDPCRMLRVRLAAFAHGPPRKQPMGMIFDDAVSGTEARQGKAFLRNHFRIGRSQDFTAREGWYNRLRAARPEPRWRQVVIPDDVPAE